MTKQQTRQQQDTVGAADLGQLALRLAVGGQLAGHGAQKLFGWFGGPGLERTSGWRGDGEDAVEAGADVDCERRGELRW